MPHHHHASPAHAHETMSRSPNAGPMTTTKGQAPLPEYGGQGGASSLSPSRRHLMLRGSHPGGTHLEALSLTDSPGSAGGGYLDPGGGVGGVGTPGGVLSRSRSFFYNRTSVRSF